MQKSRLAAVEPEAFSARQREIANVLTEKLGGSIPSGPFSVLIRTPHLLDGAMRQLFAAKAENELDIRLFTLAILVVAQHWKAQFEWLVHARRAAEYGISEDAIEAIRLGEVPSLKKDDEKTVYAIVKELLQSRRLEQKTFDNGVRCLGERQMVELISCAGYFTMIAMILVAFDVPLPPSQTEDLIP